MNHLRVFLIVLVFTSCTGGFGWAANLPGTDEDYSGHDAIVLEEKGVYDHRFTVELSKEIYSMKIRFLTQKGIDDYGFVTIEYNPSKENISGIKGEVFLPDGQTIKIKKADMFTKKIITGGRSKKTQIKVVFPSLEPGAEVEFSYHRSYKGCPDLSYWFFQSELFTVHSEVSFTPWWNQRWGYTVRNAIAEPLIKETRPGGNQTYTVTRENIPPLAKENHSLAYAGLRESICFYYEDGSSDYETFWSKDVAKLYKKHIYPFMKPSSPAKKLVSERFKHTNLSNEELIFAIYDYVTENFVSLDMLTKREEQEVDDAYLKKLSSVKSGADLFGFKYVRSWYINYILASLIAAAVPSADIELVLYTPWDENIFNTHLKSLRQFTERALKVTCNGKAYLLSPAKRYMPPGMIDWSAKGIQVLILNKTSASIEKIPLDACTDNPSHTFLEMTFDMDESAAEMQARTEYNRYESYDLRCSILYLTEQEQRDFMDSEFRNLYGKEAELLSYSFENLTEFSKPLIINLKCRFPYEFEELGDQIVMDFPGLGLPSVNPFVAETRHAHVIFRYPYVEKREITYNLPTEYTVRKCPKDVKINNDILMYRINYKNTGDHQVKVTSEVTLQGNMMVKDAAEFLRRTYNDVLEAGRNKLILAKVE